MPPADPDLPLRQAAVARARQLAELYDDLVPLSRLREGFRFEGSRLSYGSFQRGIHRGREQLGPAAHIADRLLREIDGPMLRTGLQGFHGESIVLPRRPEDRPDRARLESRFERFLRAAA